MLGMLAGLVAGKGGRLIGGALGGRTGAMIGGMAGALIGGRKLGGLMKGAKNKLSGDGDGEGEALTNEDAQMLIQLMVNAAKADGEIDEAETKNILEGLEDVSDAEKDFLKAEMAKPMASAADVAKGIDKSIAPDAYVISLMAIKLDTDAEASYMKSLADELGISEDDRNAVHDQLEIARL